ncbi:MAG: hypothetical protein ACI8UO_003815 [Verrucomicrobiales bacterium]|jgi:hypothetical protein
MKTTIKLLTFLSAPFILASCGEEKTVGSTDDAYPLKVCVVSGEELGSMGSPHVITHEGVTVKLCCESCVEEFEKDAATFVAKLKTE